MKQSLFGGRFLTLFDILNAIFDCNDDTEEWEDEEVSYEEDFDDGEDGFYSD